MEELGCHILGAPLLIISLYWYCHYACISSKYFSAHVLNYCVNHISAAEPSWGVRSVIHLIQHSVCQQELARCHREDHNTDRLCWWYSSFISQSQASETQGHTVYKHGKFYFIFVAVMASSFQHPVPTSRKFNLVLFKVNLYLWLSRHLMLVNDTFYNSYSLECLNVHKWLSFS